MLDHGCHCCNSKRLIKCQGSCHSILCLDCELGLSGCAHQCCTVFRRLYDLYIKSCVFIIAFCKCYIKSCVVGVRCPVQAECDFLILAICCVNTCGNCKYHCQRCSGCNSFFQILIHDFSPFQPAARALRCGLPHLL